jgi:hypothetical protein
MCVALLANYICRNAIRILRHSIKNSVIIPILQWNRLGILTSNQNRTFYCSVSGCMRCRLQTILPGTMPRNTVRGKGNIERDAPEMMLNSLGETGVFPFGPVQMVGNRLTVFLTYEFRVLFVCVTLYANWQVIFRSDYNVYYLFNDCGKYVGL